MKNKLIYVAHPYNNDNNNIEKVEKIIQSLVKQYPNYTFVSPIHTFGFLYDNNDYDTGFKYCYDLLDRCDELWVFDEEDNDWRNSRGCNREVGFSTGKGLPVYYGQFSYCKNSDKIPINNEYTVELTNNEYTVKLNRESEEDNWLI